MFTYTLHTYAQEPQIQKVDRVWICGKPKIPKLSPEEWRQKYKEDLFHASLKNHYFFFPILNLKILGILIRGFSTSL